MQYSTSWDTLYILLITRWNVFQFSQIIVLITCGENGSLIQSASQIGDSIYSRRYNRNLALCLKKDKKAAVRMVVTLETE